MTCDSNGRLDADEEGNTTNNYLNITCAEVKTRLHAYCHARGICHFNRVQTGLHVDQHKVTRTDQ